LVQNSVAYFMDGLHRR